MKTQLDKRIAGYSALAAAMLTGAQGKAEIIKYSSGAVINSNGQSVNLDFDKIDGDDLNLFLFSSTFAKSFQVKNLDNDSGGAFLAATFGIYVNAFALNQSSSIGTDNANWIAGRNGIGFLCYSSTGYWNNQSNKYLGVRFDISGQTHYGWVKMSCDGTSLTIHEYAYENTPNTGFDGPLPVELSLFTAKSVNGAINLSWTTQNEIDNLGFILERRLNDDTEWETIASYKTHSELAGQGNKNTPTDYHYADSNVFIGNTYVYRLSDLDVKGEIHSKREIQVEATDAVVPESTELLSAYPNPFNPGTKVQYQLESDAEVMLSVVDITGRTIRTIVNDKQQAGRYEFAWDGNDQSGNSSPSGVYLLFLKAGNLTKTQKVTRLR